MLRPACPETDWRPSHSELSPQNLLLFSFVIMGKNKKNSTVVDVARSGAIRIIEDGKRQGGKANHTELVLVTGGNQRNKQPQSGRKKGGKGKNGKGKAQANHRVPRLMRNPNLTRTASHMDPDSSDHVMMCMAACRLSPKDFISLCAQNGIDPDHCLPQKLKEQGYVARLYCSVGTCTLAAGASAWMGRKVAPYGSNAVVRADQFLLAGTSSANAVSWGQDPKYINDSSTYSKETQLACTITMENIDNAMQRSGKMLALALPLTTNNDTLWVDQVSTLAALASSPGFASASVSSGLSVHYTPLKAGGTYFSNFDGAGGTSTNPPTSSATEIEADDYTVWDTSRCQAGGPMAFNLDPLSNTRTILGYRKTSTQLVPRLMDYPEQWGILVFGFYGYAPPTANSDVVEFKCYDLLARKPFVPASVPSAIPSQVSSTPSGLAAKLEHGVGSLLGVVANHEGLVDSAVDGVEALSTLSPIPGTGLVVDAAGSVVKEGESLLNRFLHKKR
jgi:hypothetical protein